MAVIRQLQPGSAWPGFSPAAPLAAAVKHTASGAGVNYIPITGGCSCGGFGNGSVVWRRPPDLPGSVTLTRLCPASLGYNYGICSARLMMESSGSLRRVCSPAQECLKKSIFFLNKNHQLKHQRFSFVLCFDVAICSAPSPLEILSRPLKSSDLEIKSCSLSVIKSF